MHRARSEELYRACRQQFQRLTIFVSVTALVVHLYPAQRRRIHYGYSTTTDQQHARIRVLGRPVARCCRPRVCVSHLS